MLKSGMLRSHRLGAIIEVWHLATKLLDGCACTERWLALLLKLKLVPRHTDDRKFIEVRVPKIVVIGKVLTKLLQK